VVVGGVGGLSTALNPAGEDEVTLISRSDHFLFTPLLCEYLSRLFFYPILGEAPEAFTGSTIAVIGQRSL
jgi:hypothetical protein